MHGFRRGKNLLRKLCLFSKVAKTLALKELLEKSLFSKDKYLFGCNNVDALTQELSDKLLLKQNKKIVQSTFFIVQINNNRFLEQNYSANETLVGLQRRHNRKRQEEVRIEQRPRWRINQYEHQRALRCPERLLLVTADQPQQIHQHFLRKCNFGLSTTRANCQPWRYVQRFTVAGRRVLESYDRKRFVHTSLVRQHATALAFADFRGR